jgi:predicted PurR-regulated permease PerM
VIAGLAVFVLVGLRLLPTLAQVSLIIFGAIVTSVLLDGVSSWICRKTPIPRWLALGLFILLALLFLGGIGWLMGDRISSQFSQISERVTKGVGQLQSQLQSNPWARQLMTGGEGSAGGFGSELWSRIGGVFSSTFGVLANVFILLVTALYLAATPEVYMRNALRLVPPARRERYSEIARKLGSSLRWWFVGRFSSMAVTGLLTGLGLWIAQVPMALTLGLIAGVLSFVPFAGPIAASIPGILVAWVQGPTTALYALIVYVAVQLLESNLVTPLIERRAVSVPPALLVGGQLLFGSLYGFWGVLWATPLIVVVMVLVQHLYIEDVLHESAAA